MEGKGRPQAFALFINRELQLGFSSFYFQLVPQSPDTTMAVRANDGIPRARIALI
jgi:hypothetical protein